MANTEELLARIHGDHHRWRGEERWWREEVSFWQDEAKAALSELSQVESALHEHAQALREHATAIENYEMMIADDEHELAQSLAHGKLPDEQNMTRRYEQLAGRHNAARDAHERIKRHHFATLARWHLLIRALCEPM